MTNPTGPRVARQDSSVIIFRRDRATVQKLKREMEEALMKAEGARVWKRPKRTT